LINKNNFNLSIFYCDNYTFPAAKIFSSKMINKYPYIKDNTVLYEGGLLEWSNLSIIYNYFNIFDKKFCMT
jgi:hypothetical protein